MANGKIRLATPEEMAAHAKRRVTPNKTGPAWEAMQPLGPTLARSIARAYEAGRSDASLQVQELATTIQDPDSRELLVRAADLVAP